MAANWEKYGINPKFIERVKLKLKNKQLLDKVKAHLSGITKTDLQDRTKVQRLVKLILKSLQEPLPEKQVKNIVDFVLEQKIDPQNMLSLLKLYNLFK